MAERHIGSRAPGEDKSAALRPRIAVVIPCYNVARHIEAVIAAIGPEVERIYVVDDKCPEQTGKVVAERVCDTRISIMIHETNLGVGGAVMTGMAAAVADGMDIVVKIDGDGQMPPDLIPDFVAPIARGMADYTKGNRFFHPEDLRDMPPLRLVGNAGLSFFSKLSSGYWNIFDPTNGYVAIDARLIRLLPLDKISKRYLFETDLLFRVGLLHAKVLDIPMTAHYADETSNLNPIRELPRFLVGNLKFLTKRVFYNYFLRDFNIASLELVFGLALCLFGAVFGLLNWGTRAPATAGTVMLAALPLIAGLFMLISFVNFDAQQVPREPIASRLGRFRRAETSNPTEAPRP